MKFLEKILQPNALLIQKNFSRKLLHDNYYQKVGL